MYFETRKVSGLPPYVFLFVNPILRSYDPEWTLKITSNICIHSGHQSFYWTISQHLAQDGGRVGVLIDIAYLPHTSG